MYRLLFFLIPLVSCRQEIDENQFKTGDIIFQESLSEQSKAIQVASSSIYSHCGIIYKTANKTYVLEAVQPVKLTALKTWIKRGKNKHFALKRYHENLNPKQIERMKKIGQQMIGKPYDLLFRWSDEQIYCSELVWKIYHKGAGISLSKPEKLGDFRLNNEMVRKKLVERYGQQIPFEEPIVSPASLFNSKLLKTIKI